MDRVKKQRDLAEVRHSLFNTNMVLSTLSFIYIMSVLILLLPNNIIIPGCQEDYTG